jgi:hypothetical protein
LVAVHVLDGDGAVREERGVYRWILPSGNWPDMSFSASSAFCGDRSKICRSQLAIGARPAMRWPTNASLDRTTPSTAKTGKSHRDLAKMRRDRMVPVVLEVTNATTASALWPLSRVAPGLSGNDLLLEACHHPLPVSHGQTQIGDIVEIIRPVDRHDVGKRLVTVSPDLHQPHNPSHASTWSDKRRENTALALAPPNLRRSPLNFSINDLPVIRMAVSRSDIVKSVRGDWIRWPCRTGPGRAARSGS